MKNKLLLTILLTLVLICIGPTTAFADSLSGGTLTLDSGGGNIIAGDLQTRAEAQVGVGNGPTTITELIVNATGDFNSTDITYINTLGLLEVLNVATSIAVGDVGGDFCSSYNSTDFDNLTEVTFPATIFGIYAFYECPSLTSVSLPNATTFGITAFYKCTSLPSVSLPNAITFGNTSFRECTSLSSISFPNATTFGSYAFRQDTSLTNVSLASATTFGSYAFYNCTSLTSISLLNATTFEDHAFFACPSLTSVSLPSATTFGDYAFYNSNSLTSINLPNATTFGNVSFNDCDILTSISLPNATTFGNNTCDDCASLTSVDLPSATTFGADTFDNCTSLTSANLPSATTFGTDTFDNCTSLTSLTLGKTVPTVGSWGASLPASRDVNVPITVVNTYDPDSDGLWEGFTVVGFTSPTTSEPSETTLISNPQTGKSCWLVRVIAWISPLF